MIRVGIISASGYAGAELVRYLLGHPEVRITYLSSHTFSGRPLSDAYPSLIGQDLPLCEEYDPDVAAEKADIFFQAHGNGVGMRVAPTLLERGKKFVDIPADFRLKDPGVYKKYYGSDHTAVDLLREAIYGVPELRAEQISRARIVANPGCYATGAILALAPLVAERCVDLDSIVIDSKSGVSGAGRSKIEVANLFTEVNEGFKAYGVASHRHTPEIEQELSTLAGANLKVTFTPHLVPMNRGILTTAYARLTKTDVDIISLYREFYAGRRFVVVLESGQQPNTKNVFGTNYCHIGIAQDVRTGVAIITSAIDNMGKGAAGQAVQNMNLMCGFEEHLGLTSPAVFP
jgi:N-acetyl-gamma-glutamyl-phosphate reductase